MTLGAETEPIEESQTLARNKRGGWKPSSQNPLIQRLSGSPYEKVAISSTPDVPELVAGFIGTETGVISPKARVFVSPNRRLNREQRETTAALFDSGIANPNALRELVERSKITNPWRGTLRQLAMATQYYRTGRQEFARAMKSTERVLEIIDQQPLNGEMAQIRQWIEDMSIYSAPKNPGLRARETIQKMSPAMLGLNDLLTLNLHASVGEPVRAYQRGQELLTRLYELEADEFGFIAPITVKEVPVLKSRADEPDRIEYTSITFDRSYALLLRQKHQAVFVMGPSNSGKSTLAACLDAQMRDDIDSCVKSGLIEEGEISIATYSLDLTSPTVESVLAGQEPKKRGSLGWTEELAKRANSSLEVYRQNYNIVIVDFPGGDPDSVTQILASSGGDCSILVGGYSDERVQRWEQFIIHEGLPLNQVKVTTRLPSSNRQSALIRYYRPEAGDRRIFLDLRIVGLNRQIKEDPSVSLLSKFLLFRAFAAAELEKINYLYELSAQAALI